MYTSQLFGLSVVRALPEPMSSSLSKNNEIKYKSECVGWRKKTGDSQETCASKMETDKREKY